MLDLLKIPRNQFEGRTLTTGATSANLLGLAVGREETIRRVKGKGSWSVAQDGCGGVEVDIFSAGKI